MLTRRGLGLSVGAMSLAAGLPQRSKAEAISTGTSLAPVSVEVQFSAEGRYLPQYLELRAKADAGKAFASEELSQFAALLGDEPTAVGSLERARTSETMLPDLEGAEARDALEAIVAAAADHQIVILNEARNVSGHRAFANRVMRALRPLGFEWFAAEAFTPPQPVPYQDISLYRAGAPFGAAMGWYIRDPVYAEMVREAARLGYRFAAYEQRWDQEAADGASRLETITARETAEADNLIEMVLTPHPTAKIFVYCGYSHAIEAPGDGGEWFASRLKAKTGIDPLTIEQSQNWPAINPAADTPRVATVLKRFAPTRPIVVSKEREIVAASNYVGRMDMSVFHRVCRRYLVAPAG